jgi:ferrous iron transport protein B
VGSPNTGKTSLFNRLTGLRAKTGNYPGITVDLRSAQIEIGNGPSQRTIQLIDLPGLYSLEPTSPEETVAAEALRGNRLGKVDAVVIVLDATAIGRNLSLATEVLELGLPSVVVLNLIDAADANGIEIDLHTLSAELECPVIAVSARTGRGLDDLRNQIQALLAVPATSLPITRTNCVSGCTGCAYAARFDWSDLVVQRSVRGVSHDAPAKLQTIDRYLTSPWIGTLSLLAVMLAVFVVIFSLADIPMSLIEAGFERITLWVDRILPNADRFSPSRLAAAIALSLGVIVALYKSMGFKLTRRNLLISGGFLVGAVLLPSDDFRSLLLDGVIGGVGGVLVFLPQICILFFFITLLEDSGYLARGAFVMERVMRKVGLPGKAFIPMLSAHACAIPGIMAARTIENWRDRLVTILVLPLLTCSARLPVYAMIAALLFGDSPVLASLTFAGAYLLGLAAALGTAFCLKKTIVAGDPAPLVIELPAFRRPSLRNALLTTYDRAVVFIKNAGGVILLISVALWFMASYPKPDPATLSGDEKAQNQQSLQYSFAGRLGQAAEPIFEPLGFNWKINVGVISSFAAREVLVSALSVIHGIGEDGGEDPQGLVNSLRAQQRPDGSPVFSRATCFSLMVFYVLAMQCLPTQAVTRRETGSWKWAIFQFVYMTLLAYVSALIVYQTLTHLGIA